MTKMTFLRDYLLDFVIFLCFYMSLDHDTSPERLRMVLSEARVPELKACFFCYKKNMICIYKHPSVFNCWNSADSAIVEDGATRSRLLAALTLSFVAMVPGRVYGSGLVYPS